MVMFDSLNRKMLPPYGCEWVHAPNFERLARRSATFDNCYGGSMPCMPARRELHTGRYNFLHRSWGPLEPFDDSVPEMLKRSGVYTHLVTDHYHYWEDGGATYHGRYSTFEFFRGQEVDPWKGHVADPSIPKCHPSAMSDPAWRQNWINRLHQHDEIAHSQTQVFDAGLEFIHRNCTQDCWLIQIETFDPHEPYFSYDHYKQHYPHAYEGPLFDWPTYGRATEDADVVQHVRCEYAALLTMCDASLGRVLDAMDELSMWDDTMLIVCTDHGFLLGEHESWGKTIQPWYDETIHTPLFIWDPRSRAQREHRTSLVQTIDIGPTLLDFFDLDPSPDMHGVSLTRTIQDDTPVREAGLFGVFGGHVCVTDGRHVYMRASKDADNQPLYEYTLMPTSMRAHFSVEQLRESQLAEPFSFTKGLQSLRVPALSWSRAWIYGSLLFDLDNDPQQQYPLIDDALELRMAQLLVTLMRATDAPLEQYERLELPSIGAVGPEHLVVRKHWAQLETSMQPPPTEADFPQGVDFGVTTPLKLLFADPDAGKIVQRYIPQLAEAQIRENSASRTLLELHVITGGGLVEREHLDALATELSNLQR